MTVPTFAPHPTGNTRFVDRTGRVYGALTVLGYAGQSMWYCRCACGNLTRSTGCNLHTGGATRCRSCAVRRPLTHGHTQGGKAHPLYWVWASMIQRCHCPTCKAYKNYGGRGIIVCDRWRESFPTFLADVGERPSAAHSLDRKDNNGNYEPGNVRWATRAEQNRNSRNALQITHDGVTLCLRGWSERLGIPYATLQWRRGKGWPVCQLLRRPSKSQSLATRSCPAGTLVRHKPPRAAL